MIKKIIDIDKLKKYPENSYAFLWVILCFAVVLVPLTSMVLIGKFGSMQASAAGCLINSNTSVLAGTSISLKYNGFAAGESIRLFGTNWQSELAKTQDSTVSTMTQSILIPSTTPAGTYNIVIVTRFPITSTTCAGGPFMVTVAPTPVPGDSDRDGFSDTLEMYIGTNPYLACGVGAWPPDFNNDKSVNILDQQMLAKNQTSLSGIYNRRYDLNMDGKVNSTDQLIESKSVGKTCI